MSSEQQYEGSTFGATQIYFYPRFKDQRQYCHDDFRTMVNLDENTEYVWIYKTPLTWFQLTDLLLHHQYVVFKSVSYYWSAEKYEEGIVIQVATEKYEVVSYKNDGGRRNDYPSVMRESTANITVAKLIDYICDQELNIGYSFFIRDKGSKGFADRIYYKIILGAKPRSTINNA